MSQPGCSSSGCCWSPIRQELPGQNEKGILSCYRGRLIRKLLALLVNLINVTALEEIPDYIWKTADNPNSKLWVIW